jgi:hypothetical protein
MKLGALRGRFGWGVDGGLGSISGGLELYADRRWSGAHGAECFASHSLLQLISVFSLRYTQTSATKACFISAWHQTFGGGNNLP